MLASPDVKKTMAVLRYEAKVSYLAPSALRRAYVRTYARVSLYIIGSEVPPFLTLDSSQ